jgi:glycerol-3-phosphate dehydrogenase
MAEVAWAIRYEMARIDDVLARRVRLLFLDAHAAASCEKVKFRKELGHDETWTHNQIAEFKLSLMDSLTEFRN